MLKSYRELKVWEKSYNLCVKIYRITRKFPIEEKYVLTSQIRKSALSIPSNIAEGSGRGSDKDFSRFLDISLGSSFELETQLIIANRLRFLDEADFSALSEQLDEEQKMIIGL